MVSFEPIGIIHSPFTTLENMPIQPKGAPESQGKIVLDPRYQTGLRDLAGFSHIYLLYHFHQTHQTDLLVTPFLDETPRGVFATRSPRRPNPLGISIVELVRIEGNVLEIKGVDVLDGTPLLDIKPYIEKFDHPAHSRSGWMQASPEEIQRKRSDKRFI